MPSELPRATPSGRKEDDKPDTLAEAMAALEQGLKKWFEEREIGHHAR
jgi:hypothetical protein